MVQAPGAREKRSRDSSCVERNSGKKRGRTARGDAALSDSRRENAAGLRRGKNATKSRQGSGTGGHSGGGKSNKMYATIDDLKREKLTGKAKALWPSFAGCAPYDEAEVSSIFREEKLCHYEHAQRSIMVLDYSAYLENYLWPHFDPRKGASKDHLMSIAVLIVEKFRQGVVAWEAFSGQPEKFAALLRSLIGLDRKSLDLAERIVHIQFLIHCFQSLEVETIRTTVLRLVSLPMWWAVDSNRRSLELSRIPKLHKSWKKLNNKRPDLANSIEATFLPGLLQEFFNVLGSIPSENNEPADSISVRYCERFCELSIDLLAQLPTRRFLVTLFEDKHVVTISRMSPLATRKEGCLFKRLTEMLNFYVGFEINEHVGDALTREQILERHFNKLGVLQRISFKHFRTELENLAFAPASQVETRAQILKHIEGLSTDQLRELGARLRLLPPSGGHAAMSKIDATVFGHPERDFLIEVLVTHHVRRPSQVDKINAMPLYPSEEILWDENVVPSDIHVGDKVLALPKLNLQFLTFHDYLLRNYTLFRLESTYEIRDDINDVCQRIKPSFDPADGSVRFGGWARMATTVADFKVTKVRKPRIGEAVPARVVAHMTIDMSMMTPDVREEWESLRQHDILFLLSFREGETVVPNQTAPVGRGRDKFPHSPSSTSRPGRIPRESIDARATFGLSHVRGCELWLVEDESGEIVEDGRGDTAKKHRKGDKRRFVVELDAAQYQKDFAGGASDIYSSFDLIMRRNAKENNFKSVLSTIRQLMNTPMVMPTWLRDAFLGYGDPVATMYKSWPYEHRENDLDFNDTFVDAAHLQSSFPGARITWAAPPKLPDGTVPPIAPPFRCRFDKDGSVRASYYLPKNHGPYPHCRRPVNAVRFTPVQVEAIRSAMNEGLTMVVGPPGTGKTDVAVQIVSNLYHNYEHQRTVMVTHSNAALNDLFEKIMDRDVDERHLLRLGRGEGLLETEKDFSKWGRVDYMLGRRIHLLEEVDRLARALAVHQDVSQTCETAAHFNTFHVVRRWDEYCERVRKARNAGPAVSTESSSAKEEPGAIERFFPFMGFFLDAPQPLFSGKSEEMDWKVAEGCYSFIQGIFDELDDCRAFELLRTAHDRTNYLLTKQARVIAMTCTHAAITRENLLRLAFEYDTLVMEESAQIMEIETLIPMLLQHATVDGECRLKRLVLIGDHHQLPPVVKNIAFQKYCHLDQSLFSRFVRLGVPYVELNMQGRTRPTIARLYNWRYRGLSDLAHVKTDARFLKANPGFKYEYQLIDVDDYCGQGESEPRPHFIQNLGEAEYVVATFQYMRLMGIAANKISIITTYNGQKHLIRDVIRTRCASYPYFGVPAKIETVDKFQGQQNDYILLSLVRTKTVGHLRDVRRLVVAMSRARLGLYVFGRRQLFSSCVELQETFKQLTARENHLMLVQADVAPTARRQTDDVPADRVVTVKDIQHMGSIVHALVSYRLAKGIDGFGPSSGEECRITPDDTKVSSSAIVKLPMQSNGDGGKVQSDDRKDVMIGEHPELKEATGPSKSSSSTMEVATDMAATSTNNTAALQDAAVADADSCDDYAEKNTIQALANSGDEESSSLSMGTPKPATLDMSKMDSVEKPSQLNSAESDNMLNKIEDVQQSTSKVTRLDNLDNSEAESGHITDGGEATKAETARLMKLTVAVLKKQLKAKALPQSGRKAELVKRLIEYAASNLKDD